MNQLISISFIIACIWTFILTCLPGYQTFIAIKIKSKFWFKLLTCEVCIPWWIGNIVGIILLILNENSSLILFGVVSSVISGILNKLITIKNNQIW